MQVLKVHQVYGPAASRTACGKDPVGLKTALPGPKVSCAVCNKVEAARRVEAKVRRQKMVS